MKVKDLPMAWLLPEGEAEVTSWGKFYWSPTVRTAQQGGCSNRPWGKLVHMGLHDCYCMGRETMGSYQGAVLRGWVGD